MTQSSTASAGAELTRRQLTVDTTIYSWEALFRACYKFTSHCYLYLQREAPDCVTVSITAKSINTDLATVIGEFGNELIDQRLRVLLNEETRSVRELIVSQAFAEIRTGGPARS